MVWRLLRNGERERVRMRKPAIHAGTVCDIISRVMNEAAGTAGVLNEAVGTAGVAVTAGA